MHVQDIIRITTIIVLVSMNAGCKTTPVQTAEQDSVPTEQTAQSKASVAKINAQLGMAYLDQKNVQRAKQKLLLALKQGPDIPEPWYSMGYFFEATGNNEEAQKHYLKAIEVAPERGDALNNYGTFLCRTGHYKESVQYFLKAVKKNDYLDPAAAYENAGMCSAKIASYKAAAEYFKQALLKDPARTLSLYKLAEMNVKLGRFKEAKSIMHQYGLVATPTTASTALNDLIKQKTG